MTKNKLYRRIIGLADFIDELGEYDYYNEASNIAIKNYSVMIRYMKENIDRVNPAQYVKLYRLLNLHIIPNIRYIQRTETRNIPWSLISNLDEILKTELGKDYWLLFRPQWNFNYAVVTEDLITYLTKILVLFFPTDKEKIRNIFTDEKIHIFSFPFLEKTNVLLNSIIGHEIGHFFHSKWERDDYGQLKERNTESLTTYYEGLLQADIVKPYENAEEGTKILDGMYREIVSDIYGYFLFGPSLMFALFDVSEYLGEQTLPTHDNGYYPSNKYRIRVMMKFLFANDKGVNDLLKKSGECSVYLGKIIGEIGEYLREEDDVALFIEKRKKEKELFESSLPDIIEKIGNSMHIKYLKYENTDKLFANLEKNLPINELDYEPINTMQIIFAGWIYFKKINEEYSGDDYVLNSQILMRILLKSLHSSFINRDYNEKKKKKKERK